MQESCWNQSKSSGGSEKVEDAIRENGCATQIDAGKVEGYLHAEP